MSRRRRAAALTGLALLLGVLAASDVAGRERALRAELAPVVSIVTARAPIAAGRAIDPRALAVRRVPLRYAPRSAFRDPADVAGRRAAVAIAPGTDLDPALLRDPAAVGAPSLRAGERAIDVLATASGAGIAPGARVDVVATADAGGGRPGTTRLVLRGAEVLAAARAPAAAGSDLPRVRVSLRATTRQAVALAGVLASAEEVRLLTRPSP